MKKRSKLCLVLVLGLLLVLTFAACSRKESDNTPKKLETPGALQISGATLTWGEVAGAVGYKVDVDGTVHDVDTTSYSLAELTTPRTYQIKVKAKGDGTSYSDSSWSAAKTYVVEFPYEGTEGLVFTEIDGGRSYEVSGGTATGKKIVIPSTYQGKPVTRIADGAFSSRTEIEEVAIPASIVTIGDSAFFGCENLADAQLPNNVTEIGNNAFQNCIKIKIIQLPNNLLVVGDEAYKGCVGLILVNLPNSLEKVGEKVFDDCPKLDTIVAPEKTPNYGANWQGNNSATIRTKDDKPTNDSSLIIFNGNGETAGEVEPVFLTPSKNQKVAKGFTKTGYTLVGFQSGDGTIFPFINGECDITIPLGSANETDLVVVVLYAVWEANTYTVSFAGSGGLGAQNNITATYDAAMPTLSTIGFTKLGYIFQGYYDSATDGKQYYNADGTSAAVWDKTEHTTLYARWLFDKCTCGEAEICVCVCEGDCTCVCETCNPTIPVPCTCGEKDTCDCACEGANCECVCETCNPTTPAPCTCGETDTCNCACEGANCECVCETCNPTLPIDPEECECASAKVCECICEGVCECVCERCNRTQPLALDIEDIESIAAMLENTSSMTIAAMVRSESTESAAVFVKKHGTREYVKVSINDTVDGERYHEKMGNTYYKTAYRGGELTKIASKSSTAEMDIYISVAKTLLVKENFTYSASENKQIFTNNELFDAIKSLLSSAEYEFENVYLTVAIDGDKVVISATAIFNGQNIIAEAILSDIGTTTVEYPFDVRLPNPCICGQMTVCNCACDGVYCNCICQTCNPQEPQEPNGCECTGDCNCECEGGCGYICDECFPMEPAGPCECGEAEYCNCTCDGVCECVCERCNRTQPLTLNIEDLASIATILENASSMTIVLTETEADAETMKVHGTKQSYRFADGEYAYLEQVGDGFYVEYHDGTKVRKDFLPETTSEMDGSIWVICEVLRKGNFAYSPVENKQILTESFSVTNEPKREIIAMSVAVNGESIVISITTKSQEGEPYSSAATICDIGKTTVEYPFG